MNIEEYQDQNAKEIARKAGGLFDKFVGFIHELDDLGKKITATQDTYDKAYKKLCQGRGNLINRVENLRKMGAHNTKQLPEALKRVSLTEYSEL